MKKHRLPMRLLQFQRTADYLLSFPKQTRLTLKTESALVAAGAVDVDYLVFKAKEKGEIKLGDDGKIKGEDDLISGLKTQHPTMFEASNGNQQQSGYRNSHRELCQCVPH